MNKHSHDLTLGLEPPRIHVIVANGYVSWLGIIKQTGIKACFAALIGTAYVDYVTMSYATNIILQAKTLYIFVATNMIIIIYPLFVVMS